MEHLLFDVRRFMYDFAYLIMATGVVRTHDTSTIDNEPSFFPLNSFRNIACHVSGNQKQSSTVERMELHKLHDTSRIPNQSKHKLTLKKSYLNSGIQYFTPIFDVFDARCEND